MPEAWKSDRREEPGSRRAPSYRDVQPVRDIVTDDECAECLQIMAMAIDKIAELDKRLGVARADAKYLDHMASVAKAVGATLSDQVAVQKRDWEALTSPRYADALKKWREAEIERHTIEAQIKALKSKSELADLTVQVWRTLQANKRGDPLTDTSRRQPR